MKNTKCKQVSNGTDYTSPVSHKNLNLLMNSLLLVLIFGLISCSSSDVDNSHIGTQRHLISELEKNQLKWSESGVTDYSFELEKECINCPTELQNQKTIAVDTSTDQGVASSFSKVGARAISARDDDNDNRTFRNTQSVSVESLFTDLRLAILQNNVQQVSFDPVYGFPQNVLVNNQSFLANNANQISNNNFDDDDRRTVPQLAIQTQAFQVLNTNNRPRNQTLNGQFIRQAVPAPNSANAVNQFWIVDSNGQWVQLNVPANLLSTINTLPNQSFVQGSGQWFPGGVNSQGQINLQQISPFQNNQAQNTLNGTLFYSVQNNTSFDLGDFYVATDSGAIVYLNLPAYLQNQAFQQAGQRVNLSGSWTPYFNAPNARFIPDSLNTTTATLQQYSGILTQSSSFPIPGVQQSNYLLVDDFGAVLELQIPANLLNTLYAPVGQRVTLVGTAINSGSFGQQIIYVQSINQQQNVYTNTQITGSVVGIYPSDVYSSTQSVVLQLDTGNTITAQIPLNFTSPFNVLTSGTRIQLSGAWTSPFSGQGQFEVRAPIQIINLANNANTTFSGYVSNIGSISNGLNCNASQTTYGFTTDNGQQFQLYISNTTAISGLTTPGTDLPFQARIQVTGSQVTPGVIQAQTINVSPVFETTIAGTIIEIGAASDTFTCTGPLFTYRLLDSNGNAYSITTTANSLVQGSLGSFLRIGDFVQATGTMANGGFTFYASRVVTTNATFPGTGTSFPNNPQPANVAAFIGTVTGLDCPGNLTETYNFVDHTGALYKLKLNLNLLPNVLVDVGTQLEVVGTLLNNEITAQQANQILTFADPANRTPVSGTIMSTTGSLPSACNTPVYTYQFQNDNGQLQHLRLTNEAALHLPQPIANGTRITVLSQVQSVNPQYIDAMEIQYQSTVGGISGGGLSGFNPGFSNTGQTITVTGTVTTTACGSEYYLVDQNGTGYQVQINATTPNFNVMAGTRLTVSGQLVGNMLIANNVFPDTSPVFTPVAPPLYGTINSLSNSITLSCGAVINTYLFQSDSGFTKRLRVAPSTAGFTGQAFSVGSRVVITNKIESFDGTVIDALTITQQSFF